MAYRVDYLEKARELRVRRLGEVPLAPIPSIPDRAGPETTPVIDPDTPTVKATRYHALITTEEELLELVGLLEDAPRVALDTETYPMDDTNSALDPRRGKVRLISVAAEGGVGGVVDVTKVDPTPLLNALRGKTLIAHNAGFDLSFLKNRFGYEHDGPVVDTQVFDAILYYADGPRTRKGNWRGLPGEVRRRTLKDVVADYLGVELSKEEQTSDFGREELTEAQIRYSLEDAEILLPLLEEMLRRLRRLKLQKVANLEAKVTPALAYCANNGLALDTEGWREQALRAKEETERLRGDCNSLAPPVQEEGGREEWNWSSTKQIGQALELLGAKLPKTEKGNFQTGDAVLKAVASPEDAARLARAVLLYREANKRVSTWGLGWFDPPRKKPQGKKFDKGHQFVVDGRVYASFTQVVKTGRMSSSSPNLQNIPPEVRRHFVAPPGRKLLIADYKHIELVLAAVVAGECKWLEAFHRGDDVHCLTARGILEGDPNRGDRPVTEEEVWATRPMAKQVAFGILYGSAAKGLAQNMTEKFGRRTSEDEARSLMDRFFETYPGLKKWYLMERSKAKYGQDRTRTLTGRLRLLDQEYRFGGWRTKPQLRLNTPIQGSAGDGFKHALALTWERRRECPGDPKVVNLVHDEIVVELDEEHAEAGKAWLERCMIDGMAKVVGSDVPVSVEIAVGDDWSDKGG
jgi:DNA polymerase I